MENTMFVGLIFAVICAVTVAESPAQAANWKQIGNDTRIAPEAGSRVIDIDLDSIKRTATEISVMERETQSSIIGGGFSCREGDVRHGLTSKEIAAIFCRIDLPDRYPGPHQPDWVTYETKNVNGEIWYTQYDRLGLYIINHSTAAFSSRHVTIRTRQVGYDCRGYYRLSAKWALLDATDKIGGAPRGYLSPERQVSNWLCANPHAS